MAENPFTSPAADAPPPVAAAAPAAPAPLDHAAIAAAQPEIVSGARWFWWIAGLSLVNTVLMHTGANTTFVIGLGFTLIADAVFQELKPIAFAIDALALGFFFAMGWFATKGRLWAFYTGIACYTLDALIYLYFQDWMPLAFHGLALFYMIKATITLRSAIQVAQFHAKSTGTPPVA